MSNVLITSAGRRVSLVRAFNKELKHLLPASKVIVCDAVPQLSSAAQVADAYFETYFVNNDNYIENLLSKCIELNIALVIPTIDNELNLLAKNRKRFSEHNISIVISDLEFIEMAKNKLRSNAFFEKHKISTPAVYEKDDYKLPIYIKPLEGSNSVDNFVIMKKSDMLHQFYDDDNLFFSEYIDQENYDEFTCDLYYDKDSELKCIIPRKRLEVRGGEVSKGLTQKNKIKEFIEEHMALLKGARGCVTMQLFMHNETEELKGIEINPRFGGGFPLTYLAGGNYPKWIIEEYLLNHDIDYFDDWEDNLLMLRYDEEIVIRDYEA